MYFGLESELDIKRKEIREAIGGISVMCNWTLQAKWLAPRSEGFGRRLRPIIR
jgi:hypothetical protein